MQAKRSSDETGRPQAFSLTKHVFLSIKELPPTVVNRTA